MRLAFHGRDEWKPQAGTGNHFLSDFLYQAPLGPNDLDMDIVKVGILQVAAVMGYPARLSAAQP
jgi:hypothetical protein